MLLVIMLGVVTVHSALANTAGLDANIDETMASLKTGAAETLQLMDDILSDVNKMQTEMAQADTVNGALGDISDDLNKGLENLVELMSEQSVIFDRSVATMEDSGTAFNDAAFEIHRIRNRLQNLRESLPEPMPQPSAQV